MLAAGTRYATTPPPPLREEGEDGVPYCPMHAEAPDSGTRAPAGVPETAWVALDAIDVVAELRCRVPTFHDVPPFMRPAVRMAWVTALSRIRDSASRPPAPDITPTLRVWKLFFLAPCLNGGGPRPLGAAGAHSSVPTG